MGRFLKTEGIWDSLPPFELVVTLPAGLGFCLNDASRRVASQAYRPRTTRGRKFSQDESHIISSVCKAKNCSPN